MTEGLKNWSLKLVVEQAGERVHNVELSDYDRKGVILELTRALALTETRMEKEIKKVHPNANLPVCIHQCSCQECYYKGIRCKKKDPGMGRRLCRRLIIKGLCPEGKKLEEI